LREQAAFKGFYDEARISFNVLSEQIVSLSMSGLPRMNNHSHQNWALQMTSSHLKLREARSIIHSSAEHSRAARLCSEVIDCPWSAPENLRTTINHFRAAVLLARTLASICNDPKNLQEQQAFATTFSTTFPSSIICEDLGEHLQRPFLLDKQYACAKVSRTQKFARAASICTTFLTTINHFFSEQHYSRAFATTFSSWTNSFRVRQSIEHPRICESDHLFDYNKPFHYS
jgi:hypothetical protein